jgi:hypothetical protein
MYSLPNIDPLRLLSPESLESKFQRLRVLENEMNILKIEIMHMGGNPNYVLGDPRSPRDYDGYCFLGYTK